MRTFPLLRATWNGDNGRLSEYVPLRLTPVQPIDEATLDAHCRALFTIRISIPVHDTDTTNPAEVAVHLAPFARWTGPHLELALKVFGQWKDNISREYG